MNRKSIICIVVLTILALGAFFVHKDYTYRQQNGRVTPVDLFTYDQEVDQVQDQKPVLIYFYRHEGKAPLSPEEEKQLRVVRDYAWNSAYDVKVVAVNVAHVENLPLALANGALRTPAFVFVFHGKHANGQNGAFADTSDLKRLEGLVHHQP